LESIARDEGMIEPDEDLLHPVFYLSPAIREWIGGYMKDAVVNRRNWKI
jgi:hypothetical protein